MKQSTLAASVSTDQSELAGRVRRRIAWRILPFCMLLYIVAYLDRVNVGYAKLKMAEELKFSDAVYGFGAGIFFIGYFLLEVPGTLIVERWSARLWISRIMITWGIVASFTGFIHTSTQFHWIRFILGAAEAGFFPGIIVYLSHWFRAEDRGKAIALFMVGVPVASVIGAPLSGWIMERVHWLGIAGWRWVFILEGIPAVLCGIISIFYLTDRPHQASWLEPEERDWISNALAQERLTQKSRHLRNYWMAMKEPAVLLLALAYFCSVTGMYGFGMWLPTLLKQFSGWSTLQITSVAALPYLFALASMLLVGWSSDRTRERVWHTAVPMMIGSVAFLGSILWRDHLVISILMLCIVGAGLHAYLPSFWTLPSSFLFGPAAAVAVGLINSTGNVGGFLGPYMVGYISDRTHSFHGGMIFLAVTLFVGALIILSLRRFTGRHAERGVIPADLR